MKKLFCVIFLIFALSSCSQKKEDFVSCLVYEDDYIEVLYNGCVENEIPWMTEKGMEDTIMNGVSFSFTNKAEHSFFISIESMFVDDGTDIASSSSYRIFAESKRNCTFYSPDLNTLEPQKIKLDFMAFAINDEFPGFENYEFSFEVEPKKS